MLCAEPKTTPLISCLLVTARNRFDHVKRSVKCFADQTYPNKELIVVNEGPREYQSQLDTWFAEMGRSDIRTVWLNGYYTLGALRNIAIGMSRGAIYCQWDDDDFCMPHRLATQYAHLAKEGAKACFFSDQLHYYFPTRELYWDNWKRYHCGGRLLYSVIPGTIMIHRDINVRYPSSGNNASAGEDSVFVENLILKHGDKVTCLSDHGYIHMYSYHGNNQVYDLEHHLNISRSRSQPREELMKYRHQICDMLSYLGMPGQTRVMCRDGLAFVHQGYDGKLPQN